MDRPRVIAIINATPDSFYDASRVGGVERGLLAAREALSQGADALDIGGESTRPGAERIDADEQRSRVVPLIRAIRDSRGDLADLPITIDTTLAEVAAAAIEAGADGINDVSGGEDSDGETVAIAARTGAGLILMHRLRPPGADSYSDRYTHEPEYDDVTGTVCDALERMASNAVERGVAPGSLVLDPGLGFGKTVEQNLALVRETARLTARGFPILGAASRKSFVGRVSLPDEPQSDPSQRLAGSLAFSVEQLRGGVRLFRVHDPGAQLEALRAAWEIGTSGSRPD